MKPPAFVDFEARSRADIKKVGGRNYSEHPSTDVICAVYHDERGKVWEWTHRDDPAPMLRRRPRVLASHGPFDQHIWRRLGWPQPDRWIDTSHLARVAGFPSAKLEWLGANLLGVPKDMEGNALTLKQSQPKQYYGTAYEEAYAAERARRKALAKEHQARTGEKLKVPAQEVKLAVMAQLEGHPPGEIPDDTLARILEYCAIDVDLLSRLWFEYLADWEDCDLPGVEAADIAMNVRGIPFDRELAELLLAADECLAEQALEAAGVARTVVNSGPQMKAALAALGCHVDDIQKDTLQGILDHAREEGTDPGVVRLIEARQATSSIAAGKLRAGLLLCSPDGRLRDTCVNYGAHTGRWAGRGMQLQNLAKGNVLDIDATIALLKANRLEAVRLVKGEGYRTMPLESKDINTLTRACLMTAS